MVAQSLIEIIVGGIAAWRISLMLAEEEGPGGVFATIRAKIDPNQTTWIGRGLNCALCIGFWCSLFIAICMGLGFIDWLAIAGLQGIIHKQINKMI